MGFDILIMYCGFADQTAKKKMRRYVDAAAPVIEYIDKLYTSRNISLDW